MTQEELDRQKFAAQRITIVADELIKKLESNDKTIYERRISVSATSSLSRDFLMILSQIFNEAKSQTQDDHQARLERISSIISSVISQIESTIKAADEDVIRLEATQDGMRRALDAVRESGTLQAKELEKIEYLAQKDDPEARRKIGEHPETVLSKRTAASLKKNNSTNN